MPEPSITPSIPMSAPAPRIASLDQFRGYTVLGMLLVNFIGYYAAVPALFKHHHTWCSYADTIMPQFFFAVGFAFRLTFLRRLARAGRWPALRHAIARSLGLILIGAVIYQFDGSVQSWAELRTLGLAGFLATAFKSSIFQTLVHIGLTCLWVMPVIAARPAIRVLYILACAALHIALSRLFYFDWAWANHAIDGGPLGFLTWTIPLLVGSLAYDAVAARGPRRAVPFLLGWGSVLMLLGYGISCLSALTSAPPAAGLPAFLAAPPFCPPLHPKDLWTMSQKAGSVSYLTFATGFALAVYVLFIYLADLRARHFPLLHTFGQNALATYILHGLVIEAMHPFTPKDAPLGFVLAVFALFFWIIWLIIRHLEKQNIYLRL